MNDATPAGHATGVEVDDRAGTSTSTLHRDDIPEKRWCRFALVFCRCGIEPIESATMSVCAAHYLHEAVGER